MFFAGAGLLMLWWVVVGLRGEGASTDTEAVSTYRGLRTLTAPEIFSDEPMDGSAAGRPNLVIQGAPAHVAGEISNGGTLTGRLMSHGLSEDAVRPAVSSLGTVFDFRRAQPAHRYDADIDAAGRVTWLRYRVSPEVIFETQLDSDGSYSARQVEVELTVERHGMWGTIQSSLIGAVSGQGELESLAQKMAEVFQWDIDFSSDVRQGDAFRLIFEKVYLDGEFLRYGRILAAEYRGARVQSRAYYFEAREEEGGYYLADGRSVERLFLAAPCRYRRISSRFDPQRMHPVLRVRRPHLGVDYAAGTGTPVVAVADGTVAFAGVRGGNGNLVSVRHGHGYETGYAHLNGFARGIRAGVEVRQGQVIGYVGSTGLSTGPHLHFALKRNRVFIDPLSDVDMRRPPLAGRARQDFERRRVQLDLELERLPLPVVETVAAEEEPSESELMDFVDGDFASGEF